jgi:hypothetical protein
MCCDATCRTYRVEVSRESLYEGHAYPPQREGLKRDASPLYTAMGPMMPRTVTRLPQGPEEKHGGGQRPTRR